MTPLTPENVKDVAPAQEPFVQASILLQQANRLHLKLCELELKREDEGKDFCWRLSDLIQRAYVRCSRRYLKTMELAKPLINTPRPSAI